MTSLRAYIAVSAFGSVLLLLGIYSGWASEGPAASALQPENFWWQRYPTFGDASDLQAILSTRLRMVMTDVESDPAWGPYGQYTHSLKLHSAKSQQTFQQAKANGVQWITWVEAFGDCVMYAAAFEQTPDGSFRSMPDQPDVAKLERSAWGWDSQPPSPGIAYRWVGIHNTATDEDFVKLRFSRDRLRFPTPTYPDGRPATGWIAGRAYPVSAQIYDACCAKDINGNVDLSGEGFMSPKKANTIDAATGKPMAPADGLYPLVLGPNELPAFPGRKLGDVVYISHMAASKDPASPFWPEYARVSVRGILADGLDGLWCDNYACYNNFGMPPVRNGFGDWSEYRFREFLAREIDEQERKRIGVGDASGFSVRDYLKKKALEFGAKDPSVYTDAAWGDKRWLDEPVWNAYKVFKQRIGQEALRNFYTAIKQEAALAGRPDFCVTGNDVPAYAFGWARDTWLDMVCSEQTPGWFVTTGSRGIMLPPLGKYAVIYRAALEHQKGPYAAVWYGLSGDSEKYGDKTELGKVLAAEAFANNTFIKFSDAHYAGNSTSHAWWNDFVLKQEKEFGRRCAIADVGVLYSPDNQLAFVLPGSHAADHNRQSHSFSHWGFATALIDAHIPYRVLTDWNVTRESLRGLRVFVIPDAECLDTPILAALEEWVRGGGRLVVTGPSGTREGTSGMFKRRESPLLAGLLGSAGNGGGSQPLTVKHGGGTVVSTTASPGMDYYLKENERPSRLGQIAEMIGPSEHLDAPSLPSTVGAFCWKSPDSRTLFVDLVNYNIDPDADRITAAENIGFRIRVAQGTKEVAVKPLSPDDDARATATLVDGWATVQVPALRHFISVKLITGQ
jgi:hypothetical protein